MRHLLAVLFLLLATGSAVAQHDLGARQQWQPQVADTDARLRQTVEIEILGRAAVPALKLLCDAIGVALTVAPEDLDTVGERKLTIISKGLTLRTIMVQLPEALQECHWDIDASGDEPVYFLHRNASVEAMVKEQKAEIRAHLSAQYDAERAAARLSRLEAVRRALRMSPKELARLGETDLLLARAVQEPTVREMMEIVLSLPDEEMAQFVEEGRLEWRSSDAPPQIRHVLRLTLELWRQWLAWIESWPPEEPRPPDFEDQDWDAYFEEQVTKIEHSPDALISLADENLEVLGVTVRIGDFSYPIIPPQHYDVGVGPGSLGHFLLAQTGSDRASALDTAETWFRKRQEAEEGGNPHDWEDSLGAEPSDVRLHHPIRLPEEGEVLRLLDLQQVVAAQTDMSVVSDFFTQRQALYRGQLRAEMPLWHLLAYLTLRGIEWKVTGDCLVFHQRSWYNRVRQEVPEHLLFPLVRKYCAGDLTLDDVCAFVTALQRRHGAMLTPRLTPAIPLELPGLGLHGIDLYAIEAYAVLDDEQRAALRSPEGIEISDLPPVARDIVLAGAADPLSSSYWSPEQWERAEFRLEEAEERDKGDGARVWASSVLGFELPDGAEHKARFRFPRFRSDITYTPLVHAEPEPPL